MADENLAAPAAPEAPAVPEMPVVTNAPVDLDWRITVASYAHRFFGFPQSPEMATAAGAPYDPNVISPWNVAHFSKYLSSVGVPGNVREIGRILGAMERAGLLIPNGWSAETALLGQCYFSNGGHHSQRTSILKFSEVLGAELVIQCYKMVTVQITGYPADPNADQQWGTGLVLDSSHVVTNRHVVEDMTRDIAVIAPGPTAGEGVERPARIYKHPELDVAIIEAVVAKGDPGYRTLDGMVFRDPSDGDETFVLGYVHVPMTAEMTVTVHRGEVVNPSTQTPATADSPRGRIFLYSAVTRPGNSGGPIVAGDGRVIGLVVEDSSPSARASANGSTEVPTIEERVLELEEQVRSPRFYRGLPASEVVRALRDMGFDHLAPVETWS